MFPDIANSPGHYTQTLFLGCPRTVNTWDAKEGGWIRAFSGLKGLNVDSVSHHERSRRERKNEYLRGFGASDVYLAPLRRFSSTLKSIRVGLIFLPFPGLFDFILSFPLLEDLGLTCQDDPRPNTNDSYEPSTVIPSTLPPLTGSLVFDIFGRAQDIVRQLLDLPNGLHFRCLTLTWDRKMDGLWIAELLARCSRTVESLSVGYTSRRAFIRVCLSINNSFSFQVWSEPGSLDLSKATKLRELVFRPESGSVKWISVALRTITSEHRDLRRITVHMPYYVTSHGANAGRFLGEEDAGQWLDLDRLLVQFWESHSIRPNVGGQGWESTERCIECLLPEATKRGIIDPLYYHGLYTRQ